MDRRARRMLATTTAAAAACVGIAAPAAADPPTPSATYLGSTFEYADPRGFDVCGWSFEIDPAIGKWKQFTFATSATRVVGPVDLVRGEPTLINNFAPYGAPVPSGTTFDVVIEVLDRQGNSAEIFNEAVTITCAQPT